MKYLALLLSLPLFMASLQTEAAPASGFDLEFKKPNPPNSVKGVLENAKELDYVLLCGSFVEIIDRENYKFSDDKGNKIIVYFAGGIIPEDLTLNYEYYLWGQIIERQNNKVLHALVISPHT
jgi:hypothetical protein